MEWGKSREKEQETVRMYGELFDQDALDHLKERIYNETMDFLKPLQLMKYQFLSVVLHDNFVKRGVWNMCMM